MTFFSVKMRASQNDHHISGAERIVSADAVGEVCAAMSARAFNHSKGRPDFINISVREIDPEAIVQVPFLPVEVAECDDPVAARELVVNLLNPITPHADGIWELLTSVRHLRGAMLIDAATGTRLEPDQARGVRVTNMDAVRSSEVLGKDRVTEAQVLAAKVAHHPAVLTEVCISDDPEYTTGYVADHSRYLRVPNMKPEHSEIGGRVFIVDATRMDGLIQYLEETPVLVGEAQ